MFEVYRRNEEFLSGHAVSGIYKVQETDALQTQGNILLFVIVYKELSTLSCGVSYVPRLAKVVNVLAKRQVRQGTKLLGSA